MGATTQPSGQLGGDTGRPGNVEVVVTPLNDAIHEDAETVILTATSGTGYAVGSPSAATVTISDDDLPAVSVDATDATASEAGPTTGTFTVSRTGSTTAALTVNYGLTGTATNGADYSLVTSVTIAAGQPSATITVTPTNDGTAEAAETVILTISANALYTVGSPAAATVTISDDDPVTVTIDATDDSAAEAGSATGTFTVTRTGDTTAALTVNYTISGSATNGSDYASLSGSVVIAAGASSATVQVTPVDDAIDENNETVILTLAAGTGYQIGGANNDTVTIADNDGPAGNTVTIDATDDSAAEAGSATGTFTVTRTGDTTAALTVNYTISGSATNGSDYASLSGSVVIAAGASSATVLVTPVDDAIDENNETVILTLAAGTGYQIGGANNDTVTIADNDGAGTPPPGTRPTDKDQCKKGGWETFGVFKNQGDCVSWFATGGKNPPAG